MCKFLEKFAIIVCNVLIYPWYYVLKFNVVFVGLASSLEHKTGVTGVLYRAPHIQFSTSLNRASIQLSLPPPFRYRKTSKTRVRVQKINIF